MNISNEDNKDETGIYQSKVLYNYERKHYIHLEKPTARMEQPKLPGLRPQDLPRTTWENCNRPRSWILVQSSMPVVIPVI